jgi:rubrerythrin
MFSLFARYKEKNQYSHQELKTICVEKGGDMSVNELFNLAIQVEEKMSECYEKIGQICHVRSISRELMMLSRDETDHMRLLITGKNYLKEAPDIFSLKSERITELKIGLYRVIKLIDDVHNKRIDLQKAINDVAELERLFEQFHLKTIAEVNDASLKELFERLSADDKVHAERLVGVLTKFYN